MGRTSSPTFDKHPITAHEQKARVEARRRVKELGLLADKDPRQLHHLDGNATNASWDNFALLNPCAHKALHGATHCDKSAACESELEKRFPSFRFKVVDGSPVPVPWFEAESK